MFKAITNRFQEASGWPARVKTRDDKLKFLNDYFEREGIVLNPKNMRKNAALRAVAKLLCNSFCKSFFFSQSMHNDCVQGASLPK